MIPELIYHPLFGFRTKGRLPNKSDYHLCNKYPREWESDEILIRFGPVMLRVVKLAPFIVGTLSATLVSLSLDKQSIVPLIVGLFQIAKETFK